MRLRNISRNKYLPVILSTAVLWLPMGAVAKDTATPIPQPVLDVSGRIFPNGADSQSQSPIPGLFEITSGMAVLYISEDGKFGIEGDMVDLADGKNLTEEKRNLARRRAIDALGEESLIVFAPDETRHAITVFTDVDCGYCRKLHNEVPALLDAGIAVRYAGFPRAGAGSETYNKMVSVWCAKDRKKAMTDAKSGQPVPAGQCSHPMEKHIETGMQIGVRGTPAIVLEDGALISGYLPAARLRSVLEGREE